MIRMLEITHHATRWQLYIYIVGFIKSHWLRNCNKKTKEPPYWVALCFLWRRTTLRTLCVTPPVICLQSADSLRCRIFLANRLKALWENAHGTFSRRLHPLFASGSLGMRPATLLSSLMLAISGLGLHHPRVGSRPIWTLVKK